MLNNPLDPNLIGAVPADRGSTSSTLWVAFVRSFMSMVAAAGLAFFTAYQTLDGTMPDDTAVRKALVIAAIAALGPFVARGGVEGAWDSKRARNNEQTPADVGYNRMAKP